MIELNFEITELIRISDKCKFKIGDKVIMEDIDEVDNKNKTEYEILGFEITQKKNKIDKETYTLSQSVKVILNWDIENSTSVSFNEMIKVNN